MSSMGIQPPPLDSELAKENRNLRKAEAYYKQKAEDEREKRYQFLKFTDRLLAIDNHAASPTVKMILLYISRRIEKERNPKYRRGDLVKCFSSWVAQDIGMSPRNTAPHIEALIEYEIIPYHRDSFIDQEGKEVPFWWLGLYPDTLERLQQLGEIAPRKLGRQKMYCPDCNKYMFPEYIDNIKRRIICSCCSRTLKEVRLRRTTSAIGKVKEQVLDEHDFTQERVRSQSDDIY